MPRNDRKLMEARLARNLAQASDLTLRPGQRKRASRYAANLAERMGVLVRPPHCEGCGKRRPLTRHHPDHLRPLDIRWLCHWCHRAIDGFKT